LKGFDVPEFFIVYPPKNKIGMNGTAILPNPSVMTITMVITYFPLSTSY
jgi:hypothetical protein